MDDDKPKYLLAGMFIADEEEMAAINRQNNLYLYSEEMANMRRYRERKCEQLLKIIDTMIYKELDRRYAADKTRVTSLGKTP